MNSLAGETAFVTGATSGFGDAIARRLVQNGARVVISGRRAERLQALGGDLGESCHAITLDVRDRKAVEKAVAGLPKEFANISVLVNNAGLSLGKTPTWEASVDDWDVMVDTNIKGLLYCTRAVLPGMVDRDHGHVINIASVAGNHPGPGGSVYGATKSFVTQFSMNMRADLIGRNVRVTSLSPGMAETEFDIVRTGGNAEAAQKFYSDFTPLASEDVAQVIVDILTLPQHVNVNTLEMMPVAQTFGPRLVHRGPSKGAK
jgi:3-hydroxy acid dehydrogenase/malonic semialdehyde reductase